ncbi:MAG: sel1 repeat family protein [Acidobacteria bacterium]|nr:sel1 repeat family protein [Acidobacteriota bacterium]
MTLPEGEAFRARGRAWVERILASPGFAATLLLALAGLPALLVTAVLVIAVLFSWSVSPEFARTWGLSALVIWALLAGSVAFFLPKERGWNRATRRILEGAEKGDREAILALADLHQEGLQGFRRDPAQAAWWLRRLAERGDPEAAYRLSRLLGHGQGVLRDRRGSQEWLRVAAEGGHEEARGELAALDQSQERG